jgi:hypothetical protein
MAAHLLRLMSAQLTIFLFADDVALVARTAHGLRRVFHHFREFCEREHLTISVGKTKVVVADKDWQGGSFRADGIEFEVVE